ncbi:hypothetical protein XH99_31865 [Bradyrhizobium nanningense]|uniref:Uncharacterized protein n=1 Tax=Bradyrhizobium nanningense TaxID=1325118 RepID=A0A4Q0RV30_9BRAD|nr:hypothetical protein [Bradyrhizobium nanningense]RXH23311.1 hypothetical protein XH99_31865 [Bradyrhizobium nanningense]RXH27588.1 hypothetical protein XH84_29770 [Bradyrhizobium nanningense]
MSTVRIPPVPLSQSDGSFGRHVETPRARSRSVVNGVVSVEQPAIPATSTVNGTTFVVPPGANDVK